ncbi:sensory box histidine kinase/response regulator [Rhodopirellula islandica]|uniref:histidine kinase n=1 Tax=Rhodopirellula islandica TaxID=595434 RepID=A0A0J1BJ42_RHOIS|nr:ATP-binding protein [Rhodopirellula islandica]KLU06560.1 sensory box histidine kinase/response regulator [Rhodopirellula islandica]
MRRWWTQLWRRPRSWVILIALVAIADAITPPDWAVVVAHLILLPLAWRVLHRRFITWMTAIQSLAVAAVGLLHVFGPIAHRFSGSAPTETFAWLEPVRLWTFFALMATGYFHIYLQGRLRTRLKHQRMLQHRVHRRSLQIRRVNRALRNEVTRRQETQHRLDQSETTFQSLIDRMHLQVARKSAEGVFTYANEQFCADIGMTPVDVIGSTDAELFGDAIGEKYRTDDMSVMSTGQAVDKVEVHPGPDGRVGFAQVFKAPEYDQNGQCVGVQIIFWDITEKHRNEIALRDSEARKRALFDAAGDAVLLIDDQRAIVEANPSASQLLQAGGGRLVGRPLNDLISPVSKQWASLPLTERHQLQLRRGDGSAFESEVSVHDIPVGGATGHAVIIRDVTLQRAAFEAMREAKAAAEQANRTKTQFMAGISHELRTPLGGIRGLTDLLAQQTLPNAARRYVNLIAQNTELLRDVIEDILDFAAIEAGRVTIDPVPVNLHEVVGDAFGCLAVRVADKPVRLCLSIDPNTPRSVIADPKRLRQIVLNLAGNAIKFTHQGEVSLRLSPIGEPRNLREDNSTSSNANANVDQRDITAPMAWFELTVADTGIGIAPENQSRIFDAFEQADRGTNKQFGGTGLGLAIARGLAQRMGGDITVTSHVGQGSQFQCALALPLDPRPVKAEKSHAAVPPEGATAVVSVDNATMQDAIAETLLHCQWPIRTPSMLEPDCVHLHWILTDQTADAAFRIRARKSSDRVIWLTRAGEPTPRRAKREDAIVIEPLHPDELRRWLSGKPLLQSSRGQRKRRRGIKPSSPTANASVAPVPQVGQTTSTNESDTPHVTNDAPTADAGYRLLVVDDSATNRLVIHDQLVASGHHVQTADSGDVAIQRLASNTFDCVMMDLQMPNMDGTEATRIIHQQFEKAGRTPPPIIALTAHVTDQHRQLCREAGMDGYITKPVDLDLLLGEIERVMAASKTPEPDAMLPPELPSNDNAPQPFGTNESPLPSTSNPTSVAPHSESPAAEAAAEEAWDWRSQLSKHCGNDPDTMDSVCDAFLMEVPSLLKNLTQGAKRGDANKLRSASHTLKSCLRYFAPQPDVAKAAEVESAIQDPEWVERLKAATNHPDPASLESPESQAIETLLNTATNWVSRIRESSNQR